MSSWETFFCRSLKNYSMSFLGWCNDETASHPFLFSGGLIWSMYFWTIWPWNKFEEKVQCECAGSFRLRCLAHKVSSLDNAQWWWNILIIAVLSKSYFSKIIMHQPTKLFQFIFKFYASSIPFQKESGIAWSESHYGRVYCTSAIITCSWILTIHKNKKSLHFSQFFWWEVTLRRLRAFIFQKVQASVVERQKKKFCYPSLNFGKEDTYIILLSVWDRSCDSTHRIFFL